MLEQLWDVVMLFIRRKCITSEKNSISDNIISDLLGENEFPIRRFTKFYGSRSHGTVLFWLFVFMLQFDFEGRMVRFFSGWLVWESCGIFCFGPREANENREVPENSYVKVVTSWNGTRVTVVMKEIVPREAHRSCSINADRAFLRLCKHLKVN